MTQPDHETDRSPPISSCAGTYVLILYLPLDNHMVIGRLGSFSFPSGYYLYVGSAFGSGGLAARLRHHIKPIKRAHWHIDYLHMHARLREIWYAAHTEHRECEWASILASMPGLSTPVARFGASDCRCPSHLFYTAVRPSKTAFDKRILAAFSDDPSLQCVRIVQ